MSSWSFVSLGKSRLKLDYAFLLIIHQSYFITSVMTNEILLPNTTQHTTYNRRDTLVAIKTWEETEYMVHNILSVMVTCIVTDKQGQVTLCALFTNYPKVLVSHFPSCIIEKVLPNTTAHTKPVKLVQCYRWSQVRKKHL